MTQSDHQNPALESLGILVGEWNIEIMSMSFYDDPSAVSRGQSSFNWLEGGAFLRQRSEIQNSDFPRSVAIIGPDDAANGITGEHVIEDVEAHVPAGGADVGGHRALAAVVAAGRTGAGGAHALRVAPRREAAGDGIGRRALGELASRAAAIFAGISTR